VRADEKCTAFMELETATRLSSALGARQVKLRLVFSKNSNWCLFTPNQRQKFPQ